MKLKEKKKKINDALFKAYFTLLSKPKMYKKLSERENTEINKTPADLIKKVLTKLKRTIENTPEDDAAKIEENKKIADIVERILELKKKIQSGQGLKMLSPSQMPSGLSVSLAQLNAGNNSEKLKNEIRQLFIFFVHIKKINQKIYYNLINTI